MATRLNEQLFSYTTIDELFPKIDIVDSTSYLLIDETNFEKSTAPVSARVTKSLITDFQTAQQDIDTLESKVDGLTNAYIYRGIVNSDSELPYNSAVVGWSYKVGTPGTYAGQKCEIGDTLICQTAGSADTPATWNILQTNIDGAVIGPASIADGAIAVFNGTTGKIIKGATVTGSTSRPVYINNSGIPVQCGHDFNDYLLLSGGTITGNLTVNGTLYATTITSTAGHIDINRNVVINGNTVINGDTTIDGKLTADEIDLDSIYLDPHNYWNTTEGIVASDVSTSNINPSGLTTVNINNGTLTVLYTDSSDFDGIYIKGKIRSANGGLNTPTFSIEDTGMYWRNKDDVQYDKTYVPTAWGGFIQPALKTDLEDYVSKDGDTITGNLTIDGNLILQSGDATVTLNAELLGKLSDLIDKLNSGYDLVMVQKP